MLVIAISTMFYSIDSGSYGEHLRSFWGELRRSPREAPKELLDAATSRSSLEASRSFQ